MVKSVKSIETMSCDWLLLQVIPFQEHGGMELFQLDSKESGSVSWVVLTRRRTVVSRVEMAVTVTVRVMEKNRQRKMDAIVF